MVTTDDLISAEELFAEDMADPAYRAKWQRTALARAVAIAVIGYRIEHKLSQTALARQLAMRQPNVARLEAGDHNPSIETLERLASGLGLRFIVDVGPVGRGAAALPPDVRVVGDSIGVDGTRVLVAAG